MWGRATSRLILASASPRRAELLIAHGYEIDVVPSTVDEASAVEDGLPPTALAEQLSVLKAREVAARVGEGIVLAADTIAALGGQVIGKPADREDARSILQMLCGTRHEVITGVALVDARTKREQVAHDRTVVYMRAMHETELEAYLDSGAWEGKAGAYGIQDVGDQFVSRIEGSFTNVVGLPMELVSTVLASWGVSCGGRAADSLNGPA